MNSKTSFSSTRLGAVPVLIHKYSIFLLLSQDTLPNEDIAVPIQELPDPEADNGNSGETMREQENKWTDLALNQLAEGNTNERQ